MEVQQYFSSIKECSDIIFEESIAKKKEEIGKSHFFINCIFDFSSLIVDGFEKTNWLNVTNQLEAALFSGITGMYRQAFTSLRLAFELGLGSIIFSVEKVSFYEWLQGKNDIRWSTITNTESGIFSERYLKAFFPEAIPITDTLKCLSSSHYRELSEYVHGNNRTLITHGLKLQYSDQSLNIFLHHFKFVTELLLCSLFIHYANDFDKEKLEAFDFLQDILGHYDCIREFLGGASSK